MSEDNKRINDSGSNDKKERPRFPAGIIVGVILIIISKTVDFGQYDQFFSIMMLLVGLILVCFVGYRYIMDLLGGTVKDINPEILNTAWFSARERIGESISGKGREKASKEGEPEAEQSSASFSTREEPAGQDDSSQAEIMQEMEAALKSQMDPDPFKRMCVFPCPYCGHYRLRPLTDEEKEGTEGNNICDRCGKVS